MIGSGAHAEAVEQGTMLAEEYVGYLHFADDPERQARRKATFDQRAFEYAGGAAPIELVLCFVIPSVPWQNLPWPKSVISTWGAEDPAIRIPEAEMRSQVEEYIAVARDAFSAECARMFLEGDA